MTFTTKKFLRTLGLTFIAGIIAVAILRFYGVIGDPKVDPDDPAELVAEATRGLEAVRNRKPTDRRPASYDEILAPLDKLLQQARTLVQGETFDPVSDYEKLRALTLPVMDIATRADRQARSETGMLVKEYRFNSQKAEACQYLASTMWEKINRTLPPRTGYFNEGAAYPQGDMQDLRRILDAGLDADQSNPDLWYIRGVVNRAEGLFVPAARDLERAVSLKNDFAAAWNTLGLVRINLKEFDKAQDALERARTLTLEDAKKFDIEPGAEYVAAVYNLAMFHDGLAAFYARENRITSTVESQRLLAKHTAEARRYLEEFLSREPADSADAKTARAKLQSLPR